MSEEEEAHSEQQGAAPKAREQGTVSARRHRTNLNPLVSQNPPHQADRMVLWGLAAVGNHML